MVTKFFVESLPWLILRAGNSNSVSLLFSFIVQEKQLLMLHSVSSERASETNNFGQKLRDGANINRSLLALANCINALGKQNKKGLAYVPYRNRYFNFRFYCMRHFFVMVVI